jgi:O-antigen/teichoic acid export membrane protein
MFFCGSVLEQWNDTTWALVRGTSRARREALVNGLASLALVGGYAVNAFLFGGLTFLRAAVWTVAVGVLRSVLAMLATLPRRLPRDPSRLRLGLHIRQAGPYLATDALGLAYLRGNVLIVSLFVAADQLGEYVAATNLINPAVQVAAVMSTGAMAFAAPRFFQASTAQPKVTDIIRFFQLAGFAASAAIALALPVGVQVLFGSTVDRVTDYALILTLFLIMRFANYGMTAVLLASGAAGRRFLVSVSNVVASALLNLALVPLWGAAGAAWSTVATEFAVGAALLWANRSRALIGHALTTSSLVAVLSVLMGIALWTFAPVYPAIGLGVVCALVAAVLLVRHRRLGDGDSPPLAEIRKAG